MLILGSVFSFLSVFSHEGRAVMWDRAGGWRWGVKWTLLLCTDPLYLKMRVSVQCKITQETPLGLAVTSGVDSDAAALAFIWNPLRSVCQEGHDLWGLICIFSSFPTNKWRNLQTRVWCVIFKSPDGTGPEEAVSAEIGDSSLPSIGKLQWVCTAHPAGFSDSSGSSDHRSAGLASVLLSAQMNTEGEIMKKLHLLL